MLRLAQFKLAAATGTGNNVSRVVTALFEEIDAIQDEEAKWILESAALPTVLSTMGIANYLDDCQRRSKIGPKGGVRLVHFL